MLNVTIILGLACADTEMEAEVEPSLETEQRLAQEEAARAEAERRREQELAAMAQVRTWNHDDMQSVCNSPREIGQASVPGRSPASVFAGLQKLGSMLTMSTKELSFSLLRSNTARVLAGQCCSACSQRKLKST